MTNATALTRGPALTDGASADVLKSILKGQGPQHPGNERTWDESLVEATNLIDKGRYADAQALARSVTLQDPNNADAWSVLGHACAAWGQLEDAAAAYKRAIHQRPNSAAFYSEAGWIHWQLGRPSDARDMLERAVAIDATAPMHLARLACVLAAQNETQRSIALLDACLAQEADNRDVRNLLAAVHVDHGMRNWWVDPSDGARYCTSQVQLDEARAGVDRARELASADETLLKEIAEQDALVTRLAERKREASWSAVIVFGLFYVLPGVAWYCAHLRPGFLINDDYRRSTTGAPMRASLRLWRLVGKGYQLIDDGQRTSWVPVAVMLPVQLVLLPVLFSLAVKENYLDARQ